MFERTHGLTTTFVRAAAPVLGLGCLAGCGGSSATTASTAAAADCSVPGENSQIFTIMQSWYFWYTSLPATIDAASYSSPSALLDAIRQKPLDRFSYITTQAADQAFYGAGQYVGYGLGFDFTPANDLQVTQVFPGSPAATAGLERGDTVTEINGSSVPSLVASGKLDDALAAPTTGVVVQFGYTDLAGQTHSVSLTSAVITQPSVGKVATLDAAGQPVGYILFNSFIDTSNNALDQAVTQLAASGVHDLIVDERYNGGGEVSVAQHLATLIAGESFAGKKLGSLTFNDQHSDQDQDVVFATTATALGVDQVVFITTAATASASEFTINALTPYIHVATVGSATFGKPVGENGFNVCSDVLYPITFQIVNVLGKGDYFNGLPPTCPAADDLTHALGDPQEASVATALGYIRDGSCGPLAAAAARAQALDQQRRARRVARYGWRQLVNAY